MIYLLLAIICSASIALIFKYSESRNLDRYQVTSANYFVASTISLIMFFKEGLLDIEFNKSLSGYIEEIYIGVINNELLSNESSFIWAIIIGLMTGVFFFLSFIYYQKSVRENGVGLTGTFGKLGILIPMTFSIILWKEFPTGIQWVGIILSITSIIIINISFKNETFNDIKFSLLLLFLFGGVGEFSNKIFQKYSVLEYKSLFLFFVFFTALLISLYFTIKNNKKICKLNLFVGILVGIPNLFSSYFLIISLNYMKTSVVFPIYSAMSIVFISIFGVILFKERLSRKEIISIVMTIIGLALINIS